MSAAAGSNTARIAVTIALAVAFVSYAGVAAYAHEAGSKSPVWVLSGYFSGSLDLSPDSLLKQWEGARMVDVEGLDGVNMDAMSVHNGTYAVFLIKRPLNATVNDAGVIIAFEGAGANGTDDVWAWEGGKITQSTDADVKAEYAASNGELTVVFGRQLKAAGAGAANFEAGMPYGDFIKMTSWSDGRTAGSVDLESLDHMGMEFLPRIDSYPRQPIVFSAAIIIAASVLILAEMRKYR